MVSVRGKWRGCCALVVALSLMGVCTGWAVGYGEFAGYYYGSNSYVTVLGEELTSPELTLDGVSIDVDMTLLEEFDQIGSGIWMEYDLDQIDLVDASVALTGSTLSLNVDTEETFFALNGIALDSFYESYVTLDASAVNITLATVQDASGVGIEMVQTLSPETAAVTLDNGSVLQVAVTADNSAAEGVYDAQASALGVVFADDVHDSLSLENGSGITADAQATAVGALGDSVSAGATSYGVYSDYADIVDITLKNESYIQASSTAEVGGEAIDGYTGATSHAIYVDPDYEDSQVTLTMESGSSLSAEAVSGDGYAEAMVLEVDDSAICQLDISDSSMTASAIATSYADVFGVKFYGYSDVTATLVNSSIEVEAISSEEDADARGFQTGGYSNVALSLDGSTIDALASAVDGYADTWGVRIHPGSISTVSLTNGSVVTAEAIALYDAEARGMDVGQEEDPASIDLEVASGSTLEAIAQSSESYAEARAFYSRGYVDVNIDASSATFHAKAVSGSADVEGNGAEAYGLYISGGTDLDLDLTEGSVVMASSEAAGDDALAVGVSIHGYTTVNSLTLDQSVIFASAMASDVGEYVGDAYAVGITVDGTDAIAENIALNNGSAIIAAASAQSGDAASFGIMVGDYDDGPTVGVSIDETSGILADWAVWADSDCVVSVENSGLIGGRLVVTELSNSSTGVLGSIFGSDDVVVGEDGIGYFEYEDFYFTAGTAQLADGTAFFVNATDDLGLVSEGDSASYALFVGGEGSAWTQDQMVLTSNASSSMLGLSWDERSVEGESLILTATFLSPEEAGLSDNGTAAYEAATDAGLFTFATDPEEWVPNVSGAFVAGMTQTLMIGNHNVGNRVGQLLGLNSGDDIVADNGMWFSARFTDADQDRRDGIEGFDADTSGLSIGYDREFGNVILGVAYTRGNTDAKANDHSAKFDMKDNLFSLYGSYDAGKWYSELVLSYGFGSVDSVRYLGGDAYVADYDSESYNARLESGCVLDVAGWSVQPLLAMEYSSKDYDSYTESGGSLALHVASDDYQVFNVGGGARIEKEIQRSWGQITPEVSGMVYYDLENDRIVSTASFVGCSTSFVARGIEPSETSWELGAAITLTSLGEQNCSLRLGYDYSGRQDFDAHSFTGKVRFKF